MADVKTSELPDGGVPVPADVYVVGYTSAGTPTTERYLLTNVQTAIGGVSSVFGRTGAVTAMSGDYTGGQVGFDPIGTPLVSTDVEGAIKETFTFYEVHKARHAVGGPDEIQVQSLASGGALAGEVLTADGVGGLAFAAPPGAPSAKGWSPGVSSTTSTVFQNKLTVVTPALLLGDYLLVVSYGWNYSQVTSSFEARITQGGGQLGQLHTQEPKDANAAQGLYLSRSYELAGLSGVQTFAVDWRSINGGQTSRIWETSIRLYREA